MQHKIIITEDRSLSLLNIDLNESYHSCHGALTESELVFIEYGLKKQLSKHKQIHILEFGFGTGLNALLSLRYAGQTIIHYHALELYPVNWELIQQLNYTKLPGLQLYDEAFKEMHCCEWGSNIEVYPDFVLNKLQTDFRDFSATPDSFDLIFFDAFSPDKQPELWSKRILSEAYLSLKPSGILVTYSSKGSVKNTLRSAGFSVQRLPGPPGKRHVIRATKSQM